MAAHGASAMGMRRTTRGCTQVPAPELEAPRSALEFLLAMPKLCMARKRKMTESRARSCIRRPFFFGRPVGRAFRTRRNAAMPAGRQARQPEESDNTCLAMDVEAGGGGGQPAAAAAPRTRGPPSTSAAAWGGGGKVVAKVGAPPPPPTAISRSSPAAVLAAEDAAAAAAGTCWARPAALRASAARAVESRPWRWGVIALVVADLAVVLAEVALSGAHPELEACRERPPAARAAAEGLHITTLTLLAALNAEWILRVFVLGPFHFFREWQHWVDASLVVLALGLEVGLHGNAAVTANLGLIILRLARVGHALIELSMTEAHFAQRGARARASRIVWRLAAAAAVAQAREEAGRRQAGRGVTAATRRGNGRA